MDDKVKSQAERMRRYERLVERQTGKAVRPFRPKKAFRDDGFVNLVNKYGTAQDTTENYSYQREDDVLDEQLTEFYEGNGLFAKIIDAPAEEAIKHGFHLDDIKDQAVTDFCFESLDELDWEETAMTALKWSRLFGGSIVVMLINDGKGIDEPLDWSNIQSIDDLRVYDRSLIQPDTTSLFSYERNDPFRTRASRLGTPERYHIYSKYGNFTVHESRCLIFPNGTLPENTTHSTYEFWGMPEYVRIRRAIRDTELAHSNASKMLDRSVQAVYKMKDLAQLLATEDGEDMAVKRLQTIDLARGLLSSILLDADGEDYDFKQFQFGGVNEIIDTTCNFLSALTSIPQTILFGRSPAGMNSTGTSDLENWYSYVERIQRRTVRNNLRYLLSVIFQAGVSTGEVDEVPKIKVAFNPLWSLSENEQADLELKRAQIQQTKAQTAQVYIDMQAIDPTEVRKKLADSEEFDVENMLDEYDPNDEDLFLESEEDDPDEGNSSEAAPAATKLPQDMTDEELAQKAILGTNNEDTDEDTSDIIEAKKPLSVGVVVILDGKVLCGTRMHDFGRGLICGPGGHIENGETPEQAAFRETEEEFGISPKELIPIGYGPKEPTSGLTPCLFLCTEYNGTPYPASDEIKDPEFVSLEDLELLSPSLFQPFKDGVDIVISALDDETLADGGAGSGNFGHEGRPGEIGGSSPQGTEPIPYSSVSKKTQELVKERKENVMGFGMSHEEKEKKRTELIESAKSDGSTVTYNEEYDNYSIVNPNCTFAECREMSRLANYGTTFLTAEEYVEACEKSGVTPDFHEPKTEIPSAYLAGTDGTPVYRDLSSRSVLTGDEIHRFNGEVTGETEASKSARTEANKKAIENMTREQATAVHGYTSQYGVNYQRVNDYLNGSNPDDKDAKEAAKHLTKALDHPIGSPCVTARGESDLSHITDDKKVQALVKKIKKGDFSGAKTISESITGKVVENAVATSTSPYAAPSGFDKLPVQYVFKTPAGAKAVNITPLSAYGGSRSPAASLFGGGASYESEVLYKPGMRYKIDRVDFSMVQNGKKDQGQIWLTCTVLTDG